ncbi:NAD-dependent epimerase/dehydratase family protein [Nonomuraea aridisoli]|uniref:NAD(P)-dependent oxidoreductase n=1 Tax=Nonomuraea aridisoli TaxID=2070368 RepID=A0A2W2FBH7_9ACTN|nr:NAD(P)-dependent oxidoreductase [Nonomuraea aridisoli]PZG12874.1 NAD(P)-dependent oxidoreductase [Nonomuraea aridisoli]
MRVLVAGATGVVGRQLVPLLASVGHEVVPFTADLLDREASVRAVRRAAPDAVVHLATRVPAAINPRTFARDFAVTNRLRGEGTRNLLEAAGGARVITQSLAYVYRPGAEPAGEDEPLWDDAPAPFQPSLRALIELERLTGERGGLALRFGHLTGPGTHYDTDGSMTRQVADGRLPILGDGGSVFSFTHVHDAATAIVAALDRQVTGVLNVVDDHPVPMREWVPAYAARLGGPAPKRLPVFMARLFAGAWGVAFMTRLRGAANHRARLWLNWRPAHPSFL